MPKNETVPTVSAVDPRESLRSSLDSAIQAAQSRNRELAAMRKQLDRETEANDETIRIAEAGIAASQESISRSNELALAERL